MPLLKEQGAMCCVSIGATEAVNYRSKKGEYEKFTLSFNLKVLSRRPTGIE